VQLIAPGAGFDWFGADFRPSGWKASEAWLYLATELLPLLVFVAVGVLFWRLGKPTRIANAAVLAEEEADTREPALE
jgi:hypothetical protein